MADSKKALMLASVASMIDQFNIPNIKLLKSLGYSVDVAANFTEPGNITKERASDLISRLKTMDVRVFDIEIPRSIDVSAIRLAHSKTKDLIDEEEYDLIHCHSPIGGAICRLAAKNARKRGCKVIYTAHGFHFYNGAPLKNWVIYYPVEKWLSKYTDVLITINKEDFKRANESFSAARTVYVPGIGINTDLFKPQPEVRKRVRDSIAIGDDRVLLLSVGELNANKNHETVIRALAMLPDISKLEYCIIGQGPLKDHLMQLCSDLGLEKRIHFLGYRTDIADLYAAADVFVFPSYREGLSVALMEAMASGLPVVCSRIRGNTDLVEEGKGGALFGSGDANYLANALQKMMTSNELSEYGLYNRNRIINDFDSKVIDRIMLSIYSSMQQ